MTNKNTITLSALPAGRVYVSLPESIEIKFGGTPKGQPGYGLRAFNSADFTPYMIDGIFVYGLRQLGNDGGAGTDKGATDVGARLDAIEDGTYVFGAGGGSPKSAFEVELYDLIVGRAQVLAGWNMTKAKAKLKEDDDTIATVRTIVKVFMLRKKMDIDDTDLTDVMFEKEWAKLSADATELAGSKAAAVAAVVIDDDAMADIMAAVAAKKAARS